MEPAQELLKCTKCSQGERKFMCALCEEQLYCSGVCEAADFESHRDLCQFKEKTLSLQSYCAVCPRALSSADVTCDKCRGIRHCSTKCMDENADEHKVLCQAYVDLPPRPSRDHRLHILLLFHSMFKPGFVWCQDLEAARVTVAPERVRPYLASMYLPSEANRAIAAYYVRDSNPNVNLGNLVAGQPTETVTGSFLIFATNISGGREDTGDALPSDLHKALHHVALLERRHGPVKISLTPMEELFYGGSAV